MLVAHGRCHLVSDDKLRGIVFAVFDLKLKGNRNAKGGRYHCLHRSEFDRRSSFIDDEYDDGYATQMSKQIRTTFAGSNSNEIYDIIFIEM